MFIICKISCVVESKNFRILPLLSLKMFKTSISKFCFNNVATPEALVIGPEYQRDSPFHSFFHTFSVSGVECVSCKRAISIFLFLRISKIPLLLLVLCNSVTLKVVIVRFLGICNVLF